MIELFSIAFSPVNVVFSILLLLTIIYWLTVIVGVLDVDLFDVELPDSGLEADVDADFDADADLEVGGPVMMRSLLHFFYIGEVPIMILISVLILSLWTCSVLGNYYLNPGQSLVLAIPIFLANLVVSLFISKVLVMPLKRMYAMLNKDYNKPRKVIGRICRITTTHASKDKMGQAEITTKGAPIILNVISQDDNEFSKGDEAVVVASDKEKGIYFIARVDLES